MAVKRQAYFCAFFNFCVILTKIVNKPYRNNDIKKMCKYLIFALLLHQFSIGMAPSVATDQKSLEEFIDSKQKEAIASPWEFGMAKSWIMQLENPEIDFNITNKFKLFTRMHIFRNTDNLMNDLSCIFRIYKTFIDIYRLCELEYGKDEIQDYENYVKDFDMLITELNTSIYEIIIKELNKFKGAQECHKNYLKLIFETIILKHATISS